MAQVSKWRSRLCELVALEVSRLTRYCPALFQVAPLPHGDTVLLEKLGRGAEAVIRCVEDLTHNAANEDGGTALLFDGNLNYELDIQGLLVALKPRLGRSARLVFVTYNSYLRFGISLANALGLRRGPVPATFITRRDLDQIAKLAGYEVVRVRPVAYLPFRLLGLGDLVNKVMPALPLLRWMSLAAVIVVRPVKASVARPSLSIVIPARNERGNIAPALHRLLPLRDSDIPFEVIFVEGHSQDGTWEEIERVRDAYAGVLPVKGLRQTGSGKADAVRLGFAHATGDLLTILDADLTMPPELLPRFYEAYVEGKADFVNGSRLVYPMEDDSMRFLNKLGNVFFAKALSYVLDADLSDSLCGTKLVSRRDYARLCAWREDFGDFDPFGDFEFLFPAATLALGIVTIPIRYRSRTYGATNIRRFRHGFQLLKMTLVGFARVKLGTVWSTPDRPLGGLSSGGDGRRP